MNDFDEYIKYQIKNGYIKEDGTPLKCQFCDSNDLKWKGDWESKTVTCNKCGKIVGMWDYGYWSI